MKEINCIYKDNCSSYYEKCESCLNNKKQDYFIKKNICPDCGTELIKDESVVLTSYPPQFKYECPKCHSMYYLY